MALTENDGEATATAIVTVRVPRDSEADLSTDAAARLARVDDVGDVTVDGIRGLRPRLAATAVTVSVTMDSALEVEALRNRLTDTPSVETVERIDGSEG